MKFKTCWRSITIEAETKDDEDLLKRLKEKLPEKTDDCYDDGTLEAEEVESGYTLIFSR